MAVAGRSGDAPPASDAAARLRESGFVRLLARPTGDALAATGLLARALDTLDQPFQARIAPTGFPETLADDELTVLVGAATPAADIELPGASRPASQTAFEVASALDPSLDPDPVLALAGAFAADAGPLSEVAGSALDVARERGVEEPRPGIAIPGSDLADGLAHTTLVHAPFSGDIERATAAIADLGIERDTPSIEEHRRVASWLALTVASGDPPQATDALERALRPFPLSGPFATVGGYADVLCAVAHEAPGTGLALVLGHGVETAALSAWREHARRAHAAVREAKFDATPTESVEEPAIARIGESAPLATTARLLAGFRVSSPVVVVTDGRASATGGAGVGDAMSRAASALDGTATTDSRGLTARFEGSADAFVSAFREVR